MKFFIICTVGLRCLAAKLLLPTQIALARQRKRFTIKDVACRETRRKEGQKLRYGVIGRSTTVQISERIQSHQVCFKAFSVPIYSYFNGKNVTITDIDIRDKRFEYFRNFVISDVLKKNQIDFILVDTYKDVKYDFVVDQEGNFIPLDDSIMSEHACAEARSSMVEITIDDIRFSRAIYQAIDRFCRLMNDEFPHIKIVVLDMSSTNTFIKQQDELLHTGKFSDYLRFGSARDYANFCNYRLQMASSLSRLIARKAKNCGVVQSPIGAYATEHNDLSPVHFSDSNYATIIDGIERLIAGGASMDGDPIFEHEIFQWSAQGSLVSLIERLESNIYNQAVETGNLISKINILEEKIEKLLSSVATKQY